MSPVFVLDCSVTISWLFEEADTPALRTLRRRLVDEAALVPMHWHLEVANVLAIAERRGRYSTAEVSQLLSIVGRLSLETDGLPAAGAIDVLLPLCRAHGLTSYDAAYLELAMRRDLPLATLDEDLRTAASAAGVELLGK